MSTRATMAIPRPPPPDRDLQLRDWFERVDARSLKEADLDEAHDPGRIARQSGRRLAVP
jgi:hypothetical protein